MAVVKHPARKAMDDLEIVKRAARRYLEAVKRLGERVPGKPYNYFECDLRQDAGGLERWQELDAAGKILAERVKE